MFNKDYPDEDYTDILNRIDSRKSYSPHDIEALSQKITVTWNGNVVLMQLGGQNIYGNGNVVQNGGQNIYIPNNSGNIHIGNNIIVQGLTADALNKAIAAAVQRLNLQAQDDGLVSFKFYFLLIWMLTSLLFASVLTYFSVQNKILLYIPPSVSISQFIFQLSFAFFINQLFFGGIKFIYEMRHNEFQYRRVKHSYFHWCIYPILIILEFSCFTTKLAIKIFFHINNNNNRKNDIFSPFKWF